MGKGILLVVMGISIIIGVLIVNLNANTNRGLDTTIDYYNETQARLISNSGIEVYLEKLRRDKTLTGSFPGNTLMDGTYDITISGPDTLLKIVSVGTYRNATHTSIITASRKIVTLPDINSSIYISSNNLGINLAGNMDINGYDHNLDGTPGPNPPLPGIGVSKSTDSSYIVNNIKPKISGSIQGEGSTPSVSTVSDTSDWQSLAENYIFAADYTLPTGTYSTGTVLGTPTDPKITYVNGDVQFSGTASGSGIMVVNGNLSLSGNFTFTGILIVYGESQITTKTTGNAGIYGASIFVGESVDFQATGNALFYYSSQAINNAKTNLKSSRFQILSWWE